jgi:ABC-2 type transport system permease protein
MADWAVSAAVARILRLWRLYATMDLLYLLRGPQAALMYYFSDVFIGVAAVTATFLLAERFDGIGAWSRPQVLFMLGYALLVRCVINTWFNYNLAHISRRIGRGQLDHVLIQPQPLWMALVTEGFSPVTGAGMLFPAAYLLISSSAELHIKASPEWLAQFVVSLSASIAVVLAFEYAWGSLAFWAPRAAEEINSRTWDLLNTLTPFPLDGLATAVLTTLLTLLPAGLVAWYPSRALLGLDPPSVTQALILPAAALCLVAAATWIFRRGLHHYGRTGSTRYLDYGHRR